MTTITKDTPVAAPDLAAIKAKQQAMWASGDFAVIGTTLQIVGELLCEAVDVGGGERVLDVAAGNGNATLAAARRFAHVTSTDYVPALLDAGRRRAEAEGLHVTFEVADAEALPYQDASPLPIWRTQESGTWYGFFSGVPSKSRLCSTRTALGSYFWYW